MRYLTIAAAAASAALVMLASAGCENDIVDDDQRKLSRIVITSGDNQSERVGAPLPHPLQVQVRDVIGNPVTGVEVRFDTDDPGASVSPAATVTDNGGFASAEFTLGTAPGEQNAGVATASDSAIFTFTAVEIGCSEESTAQSCDWPGGRIFVSTTSSSLLSGTGSVIFMFDPWTGQAEKVSETALTLQDISFSSRGELFAVTGDDIYKVDPASGTLVQYAENPSTNQVEIEANPGGVLAMSSTFYVYDIGCPGTGVGQAAGWSGIHGENLVVDPVTRNIYTVVGGPTFFIMSAVWDGRGQAASFQQEVNFPGGTAEPAGMCMDSTGSIYVTMDGNDLTRRISKWRPGAGVDTDWFDFYTHAGGNNILAGRWGDVTCLGDSLYIIDTRNDRLVAVSTEGQWAGSWEDDSFSLPGNDTERYGIEASPRRACP